MEVPPLRLRITFDDCSVLNLTQRSVGMSNSWTLIEPHKHPNISDICDHLLHKFNLQHSCPNGILLFMEGFVLPPSESTRILKDNDIISVKRKELALGEATEGVDACNLPNDEANGREPVDNGVLLLANEEFDKETGGYQSEYEEGEVVKSEDEPAPKQTSSKKRKASTKLKTSKKKKHRMAVTNDVEDKVPEEDNGINDDEHHPETINNKKIESKKKSGGKAVIEKVKSPSKEKRKKKHHLEVIFVGDDNNGSEKISKKKTKPNGEIKRVNAETSDKNIDDVEGVEHASSAPDGAKKGPSRSARRKKAKRQWRRELAKSAQNPDTHVEPEISKTENKEATSDQEGPLKQDQVPAKVVHETIIKQEESNCNDNGVTKLVPCVVRPGHIRFEPLDDDEDAKHIEVPDVTFQWNGISKKKGQKWGLEKFSTSKKDDYQNENEEPSTMLTIDAQAPLTNPIDFDQLPLCSSPKEGDVIVYRVLELSASWTPELSSFRVGKISYYDGDNIILIPVPEYPIVSDKMDEDGPENSLYKEDGSLEIKFAALADVRSLNQSNSDAVKDTSNGVNETAPVVDVKENLPKDPTPVAGNKEVNTWTELEEFLSAKKSELMEINEEMKRDTGRNKWSYRALRGSALGPTISLLRSQNNI
ncbi:coilin-like [Bidens hawaiensis]|uniref:coilin-like n=1 Tax=Bidens hawaiensis TaxID=980011 RepID=UPI00404A5C78